MGLVNTLLGLRKKADPPYWGYRPGYADGRSMPFVWQPQSSYDYQTEAGDLWLNGVVAPILSFKARAISEVEPVIQQWDEKDRKWVAVEDNNPQAALMLAAIKEPNENYDWTTLFGGVALSDDTNGNSFLIKRYSNAAKLIGFRWEPHDLFRVQSDDPSKLVTHYEYGPPGSTFTRLELNQVVHIRQAILNPRERRLGMSPLAAELRDICSDNELANWLAPLLRNGATPSHLLIPKQETEDPTPAQRETIRTRWQQFLRDRRGEVEVAPFPMDIHKLSWSPNELGIDKMQQIPLVRLCAALGGDPMVFGFPSATKTYSNYAEALDAFGKQTVIPTLERWARQITQQCIEDFFGIGAKGKYRLGWDYSGVSWLQDEKDDLHDRVRQDFMADLIDRARAKEIIGEKPLPEDTGVYFSDTKAKGLMDPASTPDDVAKQLELIRSVQS